MDPRGVVLFGRRLRPVFPEGSGVVYAESVDPGLGNPILSTSRVSEKPSLGFDLSLRSGIPICQPIHEKFTSKPSTSSKYDGKGELL